MNWLHDHGMKISVNLHPAGGIRASKEAYPAMAKELGDVDTEHEAPIDLTSQAANSWKHISNVCFIQRKTKALISGGSTGSRAISRRSLVWILCGC